MPRVLHHKIGEKVRTFVFIFVSLLISAQTFAQEETLISGPVENGGYGGPVVKFSTVSDKFAVLVGGYGGWLINHSFMIGGGGYGLVNSIHASRAAQTYYGTGDNLRVQFGYGGLVLEYIGIPNNLIHFSVSALIGAGGVNYNYLYDVYLPYFENTQHNSSCFVLEPTAGVELNVTPFFRMNAGVGYRLVRGTDLPGITDADLSNVSGHITFKFGKF